MAHDIRDEIIDFINGWVERAEVAAQRLVKWIGLSQSKYFHWGTRYGKANEHHSWIPRDHWLEDGEKGAIVKYASEHPVDGYRRLTFMMLDAEVVAVSPSSVYRVLKQAGIIGQRPGAPARKGTGFVQPSRWRHLSTGTSMSARSTLAARFTTSARCSMVAAGLLCIGNCESR